MVTATTKAKVKSKVHTALKSRINVGYEWYGFGLSFIASALILLWRLSTLTDNFASSSEVATKIQLFINSPWWKSVFNIYGPYYLLLHGTFAINHSLMTLRLASVLVGMIVVALVYWTVTSWHGYKIGLMSALILITSFGFLVVARQATPLITQLLVVAALVFTAVNLTHKQSPLSLLLYGIAFAGTLYVPGGVGLAIVATIFIRKSLIKAYAACNRRFAKPAFILLELLLLTPIAYRLIRYYNRSQLATWLGYGLHGKNQGWQGFFSNLARAPLDLFAHSSGLGPTLSLGHLPMLPIVFSTLTAVGLYVYLTHLNNWRWQIVLLIFASSWLACGFGIISPLSLLPLVAIIAGTGCAYLLKQWYDVFPFNPIARAVGLILICSLLVFTGIYATRSYVVAWANSPATTASYTHSLP